MLCPCQELHCLEHLHVCLVPHISPLLMPLAPTPVPLQPLFPILLQPWRSHSTSQMVVNRWLGIAPVCCLATSSYLEYLIDIAAALDVM